MEDVKNTLIFVGLFLLLLLGFAITVYATVGFLAKIGVLPAVAVGACS